MTDRDRPDEPLGALVHRLHRADPGAGAQRDAAGPGRADREGQEAPGSGIGMFSAAGLLAFFGLADADRRPSILALALVLPALGRRADRGRASCSPAAGSRRARGQEARSSRRPQPAPERAIAGVKRGRRHHQGRPRMTAAPRQRHHARAARGRHRPSARRARRDRRRAAGQARRQGPRQAKAAELATGDHRHGVRPQVVAAPPPCAVVRARRLGVAAR